MNGTGSGFLIGLALFSALSLLAGCAAGGGDDESSGSSFTVVSGSGTLTARLLNANAAHNSKTFSFGTVSTGTAFGSDLTITSNDVSKTIQSGGNVVFTGGAQVVVGGFIDVDGDGGTTHMPDDGDYLASKTVTVAGDQVIVLSY